jgi:serine/threonine protein kinase
MLPQLAQVTSALSYLHEQSIIHGDLKGVSVLVESFIYVSYQLQSNILINDSGEASLTDFGLSRILQTHGFTTKTASGTWRYMAPELALTCEADESNVGMTDGWCWKSPELMLASQNEEEEPLPRVTMATDVWAFAMTVIEVCLSVCISLSVHGKLMPD